MGHVKQYPDPSLYVPDEHVVQALPAAAPSRPAIRCSSQKQEDASVPVRTHITIRGAMQFLFCGVVRALGHEINCVPKPALQRQSPSSSLPAGDKLFVTQFVQISVPAVSLYVPEGQTSQVRARGSCFEGSHTPVETGVKKKTHCVQARCE